MTEQQIAPAEQEEAQKGAEPHNQTAPEVRESPGRRRLLVTVAIAIVAALGAFLVWRLFFAQPKTPDNIVILSGRIEGDDSPVSPKTAGRILEIRVRQADSMKAGDIVASLDDQQIRAREQQAQASVKQADARVRSARQQIAVLQEQLLQTQLQTEQARTDAAGRVHQSDGERPPAEPDLAKQAAAPQPNPFHRHPHTNLPT